DDQDKALRFYTNVLGFVKKTEIPLGEVRWLTVVAPTDPDGTELLLEPDGHPAVGPFKRALVRDGIPFPTFAVKDVPAEYERLRSAGVHFTQRPVDMGPVAYLFAVAANSSTHRAASSNPVSPPARLAIAPHRAPT